VKWIGRAAFAAALVAAWAGAAAAQSALQSPLRDVRSFGLWVDARSTGSREEFFDLSAKLREEAAVKLRLARIDFRELRKPSEDAAYLQVNVLFGGADTGSNTERPCYFEVAFNQPAQLVDRPAARISATTFRRIGFQLCQPTGEGPFFQLLRSSVDEFLLTWLAANPAE
jgi:hypothetical protein